MVGLWHVVMFFYFVHSEMVFVLALAYSVVVELMVVLRHCQWIDFVLAHCHQRGDLLLFDQLDKIEPFQHS